LKRLVWIASLVSIAACSDSGGREETDGGPEPILCSTRADCPGRLGCVDGFCGRCNLDSHCAIDEICNPFDQLCDPYLEKECRLNDECPLGQFCVQGSCLSADEVTPCKKDSDCVEGDRCDQINLVCVEDLGCEDDDDCAAGEVCNPATHRCERACTPETQEQVCGFGLVCDPQGRCVQCFEDDQCGIGQVCNPETSMCEGENTCYTNRDCPEGQVCNPQTSQCTVPPPDCLSHEDCPEGTLCDISSGTCRPEGCPEDPLEPNDDPEEATPLDPGELEDLTLCAGDLDWFSIYLSRGDRLQVIVTTDFLNADHFLTTLFDPEAGEVLQEDTLLIDHTVSQDAAYLLRIQTSDSRAAYGMRVTVSRGIPCDDDDLEPNDSAYSAVPVDAGGYSGLAICPHDEDWYVVDRTYEQRLEVHIEYPALEGDLDLDLVAGDAQTLVMRSATAGNTELVYVDSYPGTRFFVRVYGNPEISNQYTMGITLSPRW
jgi:Cys-rich repeat protein